MRAKNTRFAFGQNWLSFLRCLDDERIKVACESLQEFLQVVGWQEKTFLDIGCGSGLFSLAARKLGAKVHSFDCDQEAIACTEFLKDRFFPGDPDWKIEVGSITDQSFVSRLGQFDIVYAWGVLHHTGDMFTAMRLAANLVKPEGLIYLAIYNYQPYWTSFHRWRKKIYVESTWLGRFLLLASYVIFQVTKGLIKDMLLFRHPLARYRNKKRIRGMSVWHDWVDWVGGYPFEAATPEEIFDFWSGQGFILRKLKTCGGGHGCNEFVFQRLSTLRQ
ncbi:MAG: class I SAM-dependent methyltransferase [Candidatus Omnitrophica bacterium]|nr:class I SAM-dependent methyltransferase [Candidatus Omnitrophota bacterium]